MKKICKNCQFWKREITEKWEAIQSQKVYGDCSCDRFFYVESFRSESEVDSLMYSDSEGYKASFVTGESFGCIHFKKKEITNA